MSSIRSGCPWLGCPWLGRNETGGISLSQGLDDLGFCEHTDLSGKQGVYPGAQGLPVALWQVELAAKVEQGDLADLLTDALGGDEAVGEVCFVIGLIPGFCFADKNCRDMRLVPRGVKGSSIILWHYK